MTSSQRGLIVLGLILLGAGLLRGFDLPTRTFWFDEAFSHALSTSFSTGELIDRTGRDVHPPLYYLILKLWTAIWGDSIVSMRLLSWGCGLLAIVAIWGFTRECLTGDETASRETQAAAALMAALFVAVSGLQIAWSQEIRMYALATALAGFSCWMLLRGLRTGNGRDWLIYVILTAMLLYTHNTAIFTVSVQWMYLTWLAVISLIEQYRTTGKLRFTRSVRQSILSVLGICWLYLPWVPIFLLQKKRVTEDYWSHSMSPAMVLSGWYHALMPVNSTIGPPDWRGWAFAGLTLLILGILAWAVRTRARWLLIGLVALPILQVWIVSVTSVSIIVPRMFILSQLFFCSATALVLCRLCRPRDAWLLAWMIAADLLVGHHLYRQELAISTHRGIAGAMEYLLQSRRDDEPLIVLHPCLYHSVRYYSRGQGEPRLYLPGGKVNHYTGGPVLRDSDILRSLNLSQETRIWMIDTSGYTLGHHPVTLPSVLGKIAATERWFPDEHFFQGTVVVRAYQRQTLPATAGIELPMAKTGQ